MPVVRWSGGEWEMQEWPLHRRRVVQTEAEASLSPDVALLPLSRGVPISLLSQNVVSVFAPEEPKVSSSVLPCFPCLCRKLNPVSHF